MFIAILIQVKGRIFMFFSFNVLNIFIFFQYKFKLCWVIWIVNSSTHNSSHKFQFGIIVTRNIDFSQSSFFILGWVDELGSWCTPEIYYQVSYKNTSSFVFFFGKNSGL